MFGNIAPITNMANSEYMSNGDCSQEIYIITCYIHLCDDLCGSELILS